MTKCFGLFFFNIISLERHSPFTTAFKNTFVSNFLNANPANAHTQFMRTCCCMEPIQWSIITQNETAGVHPISSQEKHPVRHFQEFLHRFCTVIQQQDTKTSV